METHCGVGGRKWRGVSSYQVKDDLHEWDTHACSLEWNICLVSLFVCVSLGEKNTVKGKERSLGLAQHTSVRTLLPNKVHFTQSPQLQRPHWTRNYCWLDWISRIHKMHSHSSNVPWLLIAAEFTLCSAAGSQGCCSSKPMDEAWVQTHASDREPVQSQCTSTGTTPTESVH